MGNGAMSPEMASLLKGVNENNEALTSILASYGNGLPNSIMVPKEVQKAAAGEDTGSNDFMALLQRRIMSEAQVDEARTALQGKSLAHLNLMFAKQAARRDVGIPLDLWLAMGGTSIQARFGGSRGISTVVDPQIAKALDSTSGAVLVRQDLEPIMYEVFNKVFPLFGEIQHEPANGLVHAFDRQLSYGDADWIGELDLVTDDRGEYERAFTNIGILATRRGVSLKAQFATIQSGSGFNPQRLELTAGARAMASRYQKTLLHGNWTDNTGTINNEKGPFDDDSFDGSRKMLNTASAVNVDPATNPDTTGSMRRAFDAAVLPITENGGTPSGFWGAPQEHMTFSEQLDPILRISLERGSNDVGVGARAASIVTEAGDLPFNKVPGAQVGSYVSAAYAGNTVRDVYVYDLSALSIPYLGSEGPTVLEIPTGVNGQLNNLFIFFFMGGMAFKAPTWMNKIRVKVA